jgi:IS4 transposase
MEPALGCAGWQIELFFRWLKQHLRIRHFYGRGAWHCEKRTG